MSRRATASPYASGAPLRVPIDVALLSLRQDGTVALLADRWLGE